jgi:hypothetical protein
VQFDAVHAAAAVAAVVGHVVAWAAVAVQAVGAVAAPGHLKLFQKVLQRLELHLEGSKTVL